VEKGMNTLQFAYLMDYITFHQSCLECFKYKNAKPLLYTVCRTRNWKQFGRKWSEKRWVLRRFRKTVSIGAEVTSGSRPFQSRLPKTGNARSPTVSTDW